MDQTTKVLSVLLCWGVLRHTVVCEDPLHTWL